MKNYLPLENSPSELIAKVANAIKDNYPIGISWDLPEYNEHPGIKTMDRLVEEHMSDYKAYVKPWRFFLDSLPRGFKSKVQNVGMPLELAHSADLVLDKFEDKVMIRVKRISLSLSWFLPFYTIYGVDETFIKLEDVPPLTPRYYHAINAITVSPYFEFGEGFNYLQHAVEEHFSGYTFLPFSIGMNYVSGLQTPGSCFDECRVFNAFFNDRFSYLNIPFVFRGDGSYGHQRGSMSAI